MRADYIWQWFLKEHIDSHYFLEQKKKKETITKLSVNHHFKKISALFRVKSSIRFVNLANIPRALYILLAVRYLERLLLSNCFLCTNFVRPYRSHDKW